MSTIILQGRNKQDPIFVEEMEQIIFNTNQVKILIINQYIFIIIF